MEVLATAIRQEKEIIDIQIGREEVKLSFADDMIICIENAIDSIKKLPGLINEFGKMAGYKAHIQKLKAFLYTNNEISETEIRGKIPFNIVTKNKAPRNKLNQRGKRIIFREPGNTEERN